MNMFRILMLACLVAAIPILASAQTTPFSVQCVVSGGSCATSLQATALGGAQTVIAQGYHAKGDGGGGEFYLHNTGACFSPSEDGGTIIHNAAGCYYRRFTGTVYMSWFGVQPYVSSTTTNDVASACSGFSQQDCWKNAFNAAATPSGNNTVSTGGMYLYSTEDITPLANQSLTCDAPLTGQAPTNYAVNAAHPVTGVLLLGVPSGSVHAAKVHITGSNTDFHNCVVLTAGHSFNIVLDLPNCGSHSDADVAACTFANTRNMVANGDTGVFCDSAENNFIHDVLVVGFDTGIASHGCSRFRVENATIDADVGIYLQNNKSPSFINKVNVFPMMASELSNKLKQIAASIQTIGPASGGGAGSPCTITLKTPLPVYLPNNDWVSVVGDGIPADEGPRSCYGTFKATTDGSNVITLVGSHFGDATTSGPTFGPFVTRPGSWLKNSSIINVSSAAGIQPGQCVQSSDPAVFAGYNSCPWLPSAGGGSVLVKDVSYYSNKIVIDQSVSGTTKDAITQTVQPSTAGMMLSFSNPGSSQLNSTLYLYASRRVDAGNSIGGAGTGNVANCIAGGGPGDTSALGLIASNIFCFGHRVQYNFNSVGPAICTGCGFDTQVELLDMSQIGVRFGHGTDPLVLTGDVQVTGNGCGTSTTCIGDIQLSGSGQAFDPQLAGWNSGDTVVDSAGLIPISDPTTHVATSIADFGLPSAVTAPPFIIDLTAQPAAGSTTTIYDVRPFLDNSNPPKKFFPLGTITPGSNVICSLSRDPTSNWRVGDQVITPRTGDFPLPGGHITKMNDPSVCSGGYSVTLDVNAATGSAGGSGIALGDLSVSAPQSTSGADFVGSNLGGGGGFVFDAPGAFCNSVQGTTIKVGNPGQPAMEAVSGCTSLTSVSSNQPNDIMVDAATSNILLSGSQFARGSLYYEGPDVASVFSGSGNIIGSSLDPESGGQSNMVTFGDTSKCPPASTSIAVVFCGKSDVQAIFNANDPLHPLPPPRTGNAYQSCNPDYIVQAQVGCVTTAMDKTGRYQQWSTERNLPFFEYNDSAPAIMPQTYEDGIIAKGPTASPKTAHSAITVISNCTDNACTSDGVVLPLSTDWIDAAVPTADCPTGSSNCGVAGPVTIINASPSVGPHSGTITVWCGTGSITDKLNGVACSGPGSGNSTTIDANKSKTFYPIVTRSSSPSAGGWYTN